jgi:hypothetical protein
VTLTDGIAHGTACLSWFRLRWLTCRRDRYSEQCTRPQSSRGAHGSACAPRAPQGSLPVTSSMT